MHIKSNPKLWSILGVWRSQFIRMYCPPGSKKGCLCSNFPFKRLFLGKGPPFGLWRVWGLDPFPRKLPEAQIKLFRGLRLPKRYFKAQKGKIELKMSKNGFGLDASDRENCALRTVSASQQKFWQIQTGRHSAFLPFVGAFWGRPGVPPPRSARKWLVL